MLNYVGLLKAFIYEENKELVNMQVAKRQGLYNRFIRLNPPQILALGFFV